MFNTGFEASKCVLRLIMIKEKQSEGGGGSIIQQERKSCWKNRSDFEKEIKEIYENMLSYESWMRRAFLRLVLFYCLRDKRIEA